MRILFTLISILFLQNLAVSQEIALTFDDAPRKDGKHYTGMERTEILIQKLKDKNVPAVAFYCIGRDMDAIERKRLMMYADAGHFIANHTYSHQSIKNLGVDGYIDDIRKADVILKEFLNFKYWFRYPYLDEGKDLDSRDRIRVALKDMGYINGYVTIDDYDWYLEKLFQDALIAGKTVDYYKLKNMYIQHIWKSVKFYDDMAIHILGRSPKHVLLLHENDLAALFIGDLIDYLREKGWEIISPEDAYDDPISKIIPDVLLNGQGRIGAIAKEKGYTGPFSQVTEDMDYLDESVIESGVFK
jgi:peptidoglycan/xylan/chitin deacetylase (PgdA/CDA1 family)